MKDETLVERLIRPEIRALKAYHVPDATGLIKLDAMENPYPWPPALKTQWLKALQSVDLNRYPDPRARVLTDRLRGALGVPASLEIMLGNGSDELIQIISMALAKPEACALSPVPTFVMYELIATAVGMRFVGVPLGGDFTLDRAAMLEAIARQQPAIVFLAYPNNPTGNLYDRETIGQIIAAAPGLVVIDEAYHAFAGESFLPDIGRYDNVLLLRTLSKQGLAGLRLGVLVGASAWLEQLDKMRLPYNLGVLAQASGIFAMEHLDVMDAQVTKIRQERESLFAALSALTGITAWPSHTNFILFRCERAAGRVFERLRAAGVLIKNLDGTHPALAGCLRVTVGTPEENTAFLAALKQAL